MTDVEKQALRAVYSAAAEVVARAIRGGLVEQRGAAMLQSGEMVRLIRAVVDVRMRFPEVDTASEHERMLMSMCGCGRPCASPGALCSSCDRAVREES